MNESNEPNYDCAFYDKKNRSCTALNKLYCKKEKCNFYKTENEYKEIPFEITPDGKVKRAKHFKMTDKLIKLLTSKED